MDDKTVHVVQFVYLTHDGITSMIFNICEFMNREKVNFDYLAFAKGEKFAYEKIKELGGRPLIVDVEHIGNPILRSIQKYAGVYRSVRKYGQEIIHINASTPYDILIGAAAKLAGAKRVVFHSHNSNKDKRFRRDIFIPFCRILVPFIATDYLACSDVAAKYMFPAKIYKKKAFEIIHNGIDPAKYEYREEESVKTRRELGVEGCLVFGNIGRFHPQKNHRFLMEIFVEIRKREASAKLLLIGTGELLGEMKAYAKTLGLENDVIFYGTTTDIPQMLWSMDAYLMPSLYEGLPVTGIEAQAAGLPLLVSDTVSEELKLTESVNFMSLDASAAQWAEKAVGLAKQPRKYNSDTLKRAGYDIRDIAGRLEGIYYGQKT